MHPQGRRRLRADLRRQGRGAAPHGCTPLTDDGAIRYEVVEVAPVTEESLAGVLNDPDRPGVELPVDRLRHARGFAPAGDGVPLLHGSGDGALMRDARPEGSPYPKADLWLRGLARGVDFLLAFGLATLGQESGAVLAVVYLLVADGFLHGQSPGKRLFGVRAMHIPDRTPAGYKESVLRNAVFALVALFYVVPLGWYPPAPGRPAHHRLRVLDGPGPTGWASASATSSRTPRWWTARW